MGTVLVTVIFSVYLPGRRLVWRAGFDYLLFIADCVALFAVCVFISDIALYTISV